MATRHDYVHPTLRGLVNLLAPAPTDDPSAVAPSASPGASDAPALPSTPPGADRAESRAVEGSSVGVERTLNLRLTYRGLIADLAERAPDATFACDLPQLAPEHLAVVLEHYPSAFMDGLAEYDETPKVIGGFLQQPCADRFSFIGAAVVAALSDYVRPLVLRDVLAQIERNRETDSIEGGNDHSETLTARQLERLS